MHQRVGFNGTVLYGEKGRLIYKNAFGYADARKNDSLTTSSAFQLASVSKMFTATAILILKEREKLGLDDTLSSIFPGFPYEGVTIRHLLTHRSGLSRYMSLAHDKWTEKTRPFSNQDMLDLFIKYKPDPYFSPDRGFHYCNTNYALLACVVEKVSGMSFDKFVKMNIFRPLHMHNSFVYNHNNDSLVPFYVEKGVPGYEYRGWRVYQCRDYYLNGVMGDKGVYSTVEDLFKFDQALYNGLILGDSTLREAFSSGSPEYWKRKDNYGFGWRIRTREDSCVYHYGWWKGFRAFFIRDLKNEKTIIVLNNRSKGFSSSVLWGILHNEENGLGFIQHLDPYQFVSSL
ncbi:MAG: serine hydrolase domain-containing protein [Bacteroidota bacterium]|nr:serine hydrolase domain-containing protein [Bacteroidota bacterium]